MRYCKEFFLLESPHYNCNYRTRTNKGQYLPDSREQGDGNEKLAIVFLISSTTLVSLCSTIPSRAKVTSGWSSPNLGFLVRIFDTFLRSHSNPAFAMEFSQGKRVPSPNYLGIYFIFLSPGSIFWASSRLPWVNP